jgi:hypothetical protein
MKDLNWKPKCNAKVAVEKTLNCYFNNKPELSYQQVC